MGEERAWSCGVEKLGISLFFWLGRGVSHESGNTALFFSCLVLWAGIDR